MVEPKHRLRKQYKTPGNRSTRRTTSDMPLQPLQSTPTKSTHPGGYGEPSSPAKLSPSSPSKNRYFPQSPIRFGPGMPNDDAKEIAKRRRARKSMTPTKPVARFDSICQDSKVILTDMAGMFSPKEGETETPVSPFKIEMEVPPVAFPVKKEQSGKDRRDDQRRQGQARRKKAVNPGRIRRPARSHVEPIPEEGSSKRRP